MRIDETTTTYRLEENEAQLGYREAQLGYRLEIRIIEPAEETLYYVTANKQVPLPRPAPLGWTNEEALVSLRRRTCCRAVWTCFSDGRLQHLDDGKHSDSSNRNETGPQQGVVEPSRSQLPG